MTPADALISFMSMNVVQIAIGAFWGAASMSI